MTTLPGRERTALVVIDVQHGVVGSAHDRDHVIGNIRALVARAQNDLRQAPKNLRS